MKILWVKSDFLHPTNKGGQIRTLEMLKRIHSRHEVHYVAFGATPDALQKSSEYCTYAYPVEHQVPGHGSFAFAFQLAAGLFSSLPVAVSRYRSLPMERQIADLIGREHFDSIVCDFLTPAPNFGRLEDCLLFQHNVETIIWRRHSEHAADPLRRAYLTQQAQRMFDFEGKVCRSARHVVAVSPVDAQTMRELFGIDRVSDVATGVDIGYFSPAQSEFHFDLVFVGSMDWLPNIDGVTYFVNEVLPLIRQQRPNCSLAVVGRAPVPSILELGAKATGITITGTVPDVRPYLWGSTVSIVPLRIGGGTRLKIYESMAARTAVVSTTVGAEGLAVDPPLNIRIADDPQSFAQECLTLLADQELRARVTGSAWNMVSSRFSWDEIAKRFEDILAANVVSRPQGAGIR